ncbi:hypothetical protein [Marinilactibacillus sp. Marseille-P9653]|uniref:hypothetical protein n=1 Tax=Marinilactibacillus sp. Marseille-P9653 TaxID=2866583 RepID=UPI001CE3B718|nr:hypothetical protein [Marinilactibacillus sp. Marseille-P9653]
MENIDVTLTYKDNFPEEYMISNEEAVDLINIIKKGQEKFTIKGDTYKLEEFKTIVFPDVDYEGQDQSIAFQIADDSKL